MKTKTMLSCGESSTTEAGNKTFPIVGLQFCADDYLTSAGMQKMMHIAKLNGRLCGAKRPHSVSEQPNFYQSLQSNPYNDSSHPSGGE